jgi:hypothetical protein
MSCTIVTAFYNFEKKKHSLGNYIYWINNFLPNVDSNMVIFTDENCKEFLLNARKNHINKTKIVICPITDFYTYKYLEHWNRDLNRDHEKYHSIELYMIWNEKSMFIKKAIDMNPFESEYYCWSDIGMIRHPSYIPYIKNYPNGRNDIKDDKIYLLNVAYKFNENDFKFIEMASERYRHISSCIGGGVIFGHKIVCVKWVNKYYEMLDEFVKNDYFAGKDQSLMACVYVKNVDMIELIKPIPTPFNDDWFYLVYYFC